MKLFNVIAVFDCYVVAESEDAANAALLAMIRDGEKPEEPSDINALEAKKRREVREAWESKSPIVGADISDDDFETLKGKTTVEIHEMFYGKEPEPKATKKEKTK